MSGVPDNDRSRPRPYLIERDQEGSYRLTVRETRFNSQNYPIVDATRVDEAFPSAAAARSYAKQNFGAIAGQFALPRAPAKVRAPAKPGRRQR